MSGILYIVGTPIGNLEDITLRALNVLKEADVIAAEDTRHTRKLLTHFGISKPLISYWGAREKLKAEEVMAKLDEGNDIALVTDAGTPGISDPGEVLIRRAINEGVEVVPVPGPSALITALSISGISTRRFTYHGFLPPRHGQRLKKLDDLKFEQNTIVLYESPHRLLEALDDILDVLGDRYCALCHELTKLHECVLRGKVSQVIQQLEDSTIAGEYVIVLEGRTGADIPLDDALKEALVLMKMGTRRKDAVKRIAKQYGLSHKELYERSLKESNNE